MVAVSQTIPSPAALRSAEGFIDRLRSPKFNPEPIGEIAASTAARFLRSVYTALPNLGPPTIGQGPDKLLGMTWETPSDHVNVEVFPDGHLEYFHEDLLTGALWSVDDVREASASQDILERLQRIA